MLKHKQPEKVWSDKGTEFKADFKKLCDKRGIHAYTTHSEPKATYAERQIRSLKAIIYKYLEKNWTWEYIHKLQDFVKTMNTRVNRITKLAPYKVTKKDVPRIIGEAIERREAMRGKPKFKIGDTVRMSGYNVPFKKGYQQNFTDEVFTITDIATVTPVCYRVKNSRGVKINGIFYQPELIKVKTSS